MNIWNDLLFPLRQKIIKFIWAALNNPILHEKESNNMSATATKPGRVVLNKTAMEALMMEPDIETLIISAIRILIAKESFFDAENAVEDGHNDNIYEHDDIHSARSRAPRYRVLQLDDDDVKIEKDWDEHEHEHEHEHAA
jgi:hypothetical protein